MEKQAVKNQFEGPLSPEGVSEVPEILEEITIEEMAVDGICGIY
ncbi:MAG: variant-type mycofactocin precursor [Desulfomonilaceae bacterium]